MEILLVGFYILLLTFLFIYGLNIFYLTFLAHYHRGYEKVLSPLTIYPKVTIQLPIFNERYVAERAIIAAASLEWPLDLLQIQVLDDSTDDTSLIISEIVTHLQLQGINIQHLRRGHRRGFKAGALADALHKAEGEFIAIFDADFLPTPNFLQKTIPHFSDPTIAFVQTRWGHLNPQYSLLTHLQSIAIDAHFAIEQYARNRAGFLMNFNGTAGLWRKMAIETVGGWHSDTLTEDLDLSYRVQLNGWCGLYLRDIEVPSEVPVSLNAFRRQQHRWARGSVECARKLLPQIFRSHLSLMLKFQALLHLTGYAIQLLMALVVITYLPLLLIVTPHSKLNAFYLFTAVFTLTFFAPTIYLISGQRQLGKPWHSQISKIVLLSLLGVGMMYHNAAAVLAGLYSRSPAVFERTPKYGVIDQGQSWNQYGAYRLKLSPTMLFEVIMVFYNSFTLYIALQENNWSIAFYTAFFMTGLVFVVSLNIYQEIRQLGVSFRPPELQGPIGKNSRPLLTEPDQ